MLTVKRIRKAVKERCLMKLISNNEMKMAEVKELQHTNCSTKAISF